MKTTGFMHFRTAPQDDMVYLFRTQISDVSNRGGATVAYEIDLENNKLHLGYSICSKKDMFNKKIGRATSATRLAFGKAYGGDAKFYVEVPYYSTYMKSLRQIALLCMPPMKVVLTEQAYA